MTNLTETLIMPSNVQLLPVAELPERVREQLEWTDGDFAVTQLRSRTPSRVINSDFACLLNEFQQEKTIVEAVLNYSVREATDPKQTLDDAFPLLQQFVHHGLLVSPTEAEQEINQPLERGAQVAGFTIIRRVRSLQDSEIYQARSATHALVALKIKQPQASNRIDQQLAQEARLLRILNGEGVPHLHEHGTWHDRPYIAIDWCKGINVLQRAQEIRTEREQLLALCHTILTAYAALHERGIMHGDIHPGNILVDGADRVTLIDFGLAHSAEIPAIGRGGVAFYYDPDYAIAFLDKQRSPFANPGSEQYALAALLYQVITGTTYIDFSLEEDALYHQISQQTPKSFSDANVEPWPQVEVVLLKALAKAPSDRFASIADFAAALKAVTPVKAIEVQPVSVKTGTMLPDLLEQLSLDGDLLANGLPRSPFASVNYGSAGVAYVLYRLACVRQQPELLALADVWLTRAEIAIGDDAGFYNAALDLGVAEIGRISTYHSPVGVHAVRIMLAHAMGDKRSLYMALDQFVRTAGQPSDNLDITLGKAGVILTSALLISLLADSELVAQSGLLELGQRMLDDLWQTLDQYRPIGADCELTNLGIAHGWGGMLLATLRWHDVAQTALPTNFSSRLQQLAQQAEAAGRGLHWPWESGRDASMSGWCNGSAGYVYLWLAARRILDDPGYLQLATDAAWHVWEHPAGGATLCCGLAGRSYSLLTLYNETGATKWLARAQRLMARAVREMDLPSAEYEGFEMSLYKGQIAVALLHEELRQPQTARFPFFAW